MLFNSIHFLIFFPIVALLHFAIPHKWRWALLLVASYYFYMSWKAEYAILLLLSTSLAYFAGLALGKTDKPHNRKIILWSCLTFLLGVLFTYKYFNFASSSLNSFFSFFLIPLDVPIVNLLLPIGISFYTFQKVSYVVDVYYGHAKVEKNFGIFAVYSCFFPQLVAGPIERAQNLIHQFYEKHEFSNKRATEGLRLMLWGFFKKIVVADRLAVLVQTVYSDPQSYGGLSLLVATLFFSFQIYCDFSGYTDIALGSAKMLGFDLMANFRQPYFSQSIPEFWRRWHISLSSWFKQYLYIPLGGNRVVKWRWYYNLFITFLVSGLWHGANWTFAVWGALHGLYMVVDSLIGSWRDSFQAKLRSAASRYAFQSFNLCLTLFLVLIAWVPFRANNIHDAWYIFTHLFSDITQWSDIGKQSLYFRGMGLTLTELIYSGVFTGIVILYDWLDRQGTAWAYIAAKPIMVRWFIYYLLLYFILFYAPYNQAQNFIYFQF